MVGPAGFEPATTDSRSRHPTMLDYGPNRKEVVCGWCRGRDLNPRGDNTTGFPAHALNRSLFCLKTGAVPGSATPALFYFHFVLCCFAIINFSLLLVFHSKKLCLSFVYVFYKTCYEVNLGFNITNIRYCPWGMNVSPRDT